MMSGWFSRAAGRMHVHRSSRYVTALIRRLRSDRRGTVAMVVAVGALPLFAAVGVGVDVSSLVEAKTRLQNAADAAALAGASLYTSASQSTTAANSADAYFDKYAKGGFATLTRTATASLPGVPPTITVAATASMPTTFMKVVSISSMTVTVTAVASISSAGPVITCSKLVPCGSPSQVLSASGVKSTASDWNSIYMYVVPASGGFPPLAQFYEVGSNCSASIDSNWTSSSRCNSGFGPVAPTVQNYPISSDQPISFMFVNMNNGMAPSPPGSSASCVPVNNKPLPSYCGYGPNQWGAQPGDYELMTTASMSSGQSPSQITDDSVNIINSLGFAISQNATQYYKVNNSALSNCALQIQLVDPNNLPTSPPYPGVCLAANDPKSGYQYANLSCNQIAGRTFMYWWNDMGASVDDYDYKNLAYILTCVPGATNPDGGTYSGTSTSSSGSTAGKPATLVQ